MKQSTKRHMTIMVCMIASLFTNQISAQDVEPNNDIATAQQFISPNSAISGELGFDGDLDDIFGLLPGDDGNITITANFDATMTGRLRLNYKNGIQLDLTTIGTGENIATASCIANDTVYAWVEHWTGSGSYDLLFEVDSPPANEQDVEPNNTFAIANAFLVPGETVEGRMGYNGVGIADLDDIYGLLPGDDGNITITANFDATMTGRLRLNYKNGTQLDLTTIGTGENIATASCVANDTVYAWVEQWSGCGSYDLLFEVDSPPANDQDIEPNNSIAAANVFMTPGEIVEGRMGYNGVGISDLDDIYGLLPGDDGSITITANFDSTMTGRLRLNYKNGIQLALTSISTGENIATASCIANDTVYAWVEHWGGCGSYDLLFEVDSPPANDQDVEPNNSIAAANVFMTPGEILEGRMGYNGVGIADLDDRYGLLPGDDGSITITANFDAAMTGRLRLNYKNGLQLAVTSVSTGESIATASCLANDTVYAWVEHWTGCGSYTLLFEAEATTLANDSEPNNILADSNPMLTAEKVRGRLGFAGVGINSDLDDYYSFEVVEAPFELDAKITPTDGLSLRLRLYNSGGVQLALSAVSAVDFSMPFTISTPGTYHIQVEHWTNCGSYQLGDLCGQYPTVILTTPGPLDKCPGEAVDLAAAPGLDAYEWLSSGLLAASGQAYSPSTPGNYQVVGYDINGCPDTSAVVIVADWDCNDNDPCTDDSCTPEVGCVNTYSGDDDSDGTCNNLDLCPLDPEKIAPGTCGCGNPEPGTTCDDDDNTTMDDLITAECVCLGTPIPCPGDVNGDFIVDINDFISFNSAFGSSCTGCPEDLNEDGGVDVEDFLILNSNYGNNCLAFIANNGVVRGVNPQLQSDMNQQALSDINPDLAKQIEDLESSIEIDIVPNPNEGRRFKVWLNTIETEEHLVKVEILDITGKRVHAEDVYLKKGDTSFFIEPYSALETGMYLVHFRIGTASYAERMSVQ